MDKKRIAESFSHAARNYDAMAYFQRDVGNDLLACVRQKRTQSIMDLGSGTGAFSQQLIDRFNPELFVATDLAHGMNCYARSKHENYQQNKWVTADAESLPFSNNSFDLIFANLSLQWCDQIRALSEQIYAVLKPEGLLWYSTLLSGSLKELSESWKQVDQFQHVNHFFTQDDIVKAWHDSALNLETVVQKTFKLEFENPMQLMRELKGIGAHYMDSNHNPGMTSPGSLKRMLQSYEQFRNEHGLYVATYEVLMLGVKKQ